ncbi:MAG: rRNA maturation RNase YbeY [Alphaproteobacteria bacterium HGW-Alphaproteobacteria-2]|nr:MAG: rRNA maturation RNase YbeY [Alphaproteobacteria bacterium HGW-Alphaproteobacteria-2]
MDDPVEAVVEDDRWNGIDIEELARAACRAVFADRGLAPNDFGVAVLAADDARVAALNADFRGKPTATNVLSWPETALQPEGEGDLPAEPRPGTPGDPAHLGDIALAWETCMCEAAEAGRPLRDHVLHLLVHGCLHLLGYDHERDGDAALMEGTEVRILATLGVPDPY